MSTAVSSTQSHPSDSPQWRNVAAEHTAMADLQTTISELFAADPGRHQTYSAQAAGIFFDYSKHRLTDAALTALLQLAESAGMQAAIAAMFAGEQVNNTEQRPALHVALRSPHTNTDQEQAVHAALRQMSVFVAAVHNGSWKGFSDESITDVVNIGIGGSDLGPAMVYAALTPYHQSSICCHFVSNVDPLHLEQTLGKLDARRTLFVIASKTFTTMETSLNASAARRWMLAQGATEQTLARHFVAVSANIKKAVAFGIAEENIFPMWDWVGGRYSLWSAIGLPVALGAGMANFQALLTGAHEMDEHFRTTEAAHNIPVLMALLNLWYSNFWQAQSKVILPYAQNLHLLPAYLQQLDMESLGKSVLKDGTPINTDSGSILWGSAGTNGQHSFHQLLHQGSMLIPADFIAVASSQSSNEEQHQQLLANCFAQSQALMQGKTETAALEALLAQGLSREAALQLAPHKAITGNRPSSTLLLEKLTPQTLGSLLALYEHKVYAHSVLLGINAFDQWGVELGKMLGTGTYQALIAPEACSAFDASTNNLINMVRKK